LLYNLGECRIFVVLIIIMATDKFNMYSLLLDRTAKRVKQYAQFCFNSGNFGVTVDQWMVLKTLGQGEHLSQKELAERCDKDQPTLTRIVDILVHKGLVERVIHPNDRRSFILHLTSLGTQKLHELNEKVVGIRMQAWKNLDEADFEHLKRILNTIYDNLELKSER
jgi:DNA-binding MarR family transcriptional regulator